MAYKSPIQKLLGTNWMKYGDTDRRFYGTTDGGMNNEHEEMRGRSEGTVTSEFADRTVS